MEQRSPLLANPTAVYLIAFVIVCAAIFAVRVEPTYAQGGKGTLNGTVTDQTGALIPGATIVVTNMLTGETKELVSAADGGYTVPFLPVGNYSIAVTQHGFKSKTQSGITLTTDQIATVNIQLQLGDVTQHVDVSAEAEMLNTTTGAIGQVVNQSSVNELPLNGRNPAQLVFLAPGAIDGTITGATATPGSGSGPPTETAASVNGSRMGGVYYMLDGSNSMDTYFQSADPFPNPDATQEFRVITNNFDAQYGFAPGAVVSVATRSGTNNWHGDGFDFLRNNALNASDFFSHVPDTIKRNQFGGSVGGPIKKDKLFIFGNLQITDAHQKQSSGYAFVPSTAMRNGDFSYYLTPAGGDVQLHNPDGSIIPGDMIDPTKFDKTIVNFLNKGVPAATDPSGLYRLLDVPLNNKTEEWTSKVDYNLSEKNRLSGRAYYYNYLQPQNDGGGDFIIAQRSNGARYQNYLGNWVSTIRPTLTNNLSISYNRTNSSAIPGITGVTWMSLGADFHSQDLYPTLGAFLGPFSFSQIPVVQKRHSYIVNDTVSWSKGKHLVVAGVNILSEYSRFYASWLADPLPFFNGQVTGAALADMMLGYENLFEEGGGSDILMTTVNRAAFAQDTIRLKPNLTVNVGLRWEPYYAPVSSKGRLAGFWPGHQSTRWPNAPEGLVFPGDAGFPEGGWFNNVASFTPRVSVAWQPGALPKTSIRAAFGMFRQPIDYSGYNNIGSDAPFSPTYVITPNLETGGVLHFSTPWADYAPTGDTEPFPPFASYSYVPPSNVGITLPVGLPSVFDVHFKMGTVQSWNFTVEHQLASDILFRVAYVGSESYHLGVPVDENPGYYSAGGGRIRYPNYSSILTYEAANTASYNGLQISFEKRFSHNLQYTSNYSWSKNIDAGSITTSANTGSVGDPFDLSWNRGISDLNIPQIWSNFWVYHTPGLKSYSKFVSSVMGNWELSGVWQLHSGVPFSVYGGFGNNNSDAQVFGDRADLTGQPFNVRQGPKSQWVAQYFNPAAFTTNAPGTFGDSGRNLMYGPGYNNADLMIGKEFPFKERYKVQFRWEMFNAFNRAWLGLPATDPSSPSTFGQIFGTAGPPRIMQGALKIYW
jgi:hypothetical protein